MAVDAVEAVEDIVSKEMLGENSSVLSQKIVMLEKELANRQHLIGLKNQRIRELHFENTKLRDAYNNLLMQLLRKTKDVYHDCYYINKISNENDKLSEQNELLQKKLGGKKLSEVQVASG